MNEELYRIEVVAIDGSHRRLDAYRGRTLLVVNVASACGYTPQYAGIEALYRKFLDRGLVVLGFPCDQFGHQEPGTDADVLRFCTQQYGVTFPMFSKVKVNGPEAHPLFRYLRSQKKGILGTARIKWNFSKFLIGPAGTVLARFGSAATPSSLEADIVAALAPVGAAT